ncbi:FAD-dependent oxidoreductase [Salsuginibacillus kocurii]|uniref:FAD-dependent oxidoreductase n=1 Tax=Salsuginibacillus kocurii TaxID=427078 RepID=UPI000368BBA5|nr:FAD-dependent oxidoreductase [Salsuginibacillus kocurii]
MKRNKKREETRRRITKHAFEHFYEKGFEKTTVEEITTSAGVGKGTFFTYFPTKEDVLRELARERIEAVQNQFSLQLRNQPVKQLQVFISSLLSDFDERPLFYAKLWTEAARQEPLLVTAWQNQLLAAMSGLNYENALHYAHIVNSHFLYILITEMPRSRARLLAAVIQLIEYSLYTILEQRSPSHMKRLVVLGGGYGGMKILSQLLPKDLPEDIEITLVDKLPYHCLKTEYYALAAGTESDQEVRVPFPEHEQLNYYFGTVEEIDLENEQISFQDKEPINYDYLVIGLGAEDKYHGVPGAAEYTYSIQSMEETRRTCETLNNLPPQSNVSIVGAGLSGVELASELRESRSDLSIKLFDRGDTILPMFPDRLSNYVQNWFEKHQVDVISNSDITKVEENGLYNHEDWIPADATIWTAGIQPAKVIRDLDVEKDKSGRVILTKHHFLPDNDRVFVVGDCASLPHAPSAQLAESQGEQIVSILKKQWNNEPLPEQMPKMKLKGVLGSLGKKHGFGMMGEKAAVTGRVARLLKSGVLWMYKYHSGV